MTPLPANRWLRSLLTTRRLRTAKRHPCRRCSSHLLSTSRTPHRRCSPSVCVAIICKTVRPTSLSFATLTCSTARQLFLKTALFIKAMFLTLSKEGRDMFFLFAVGSFFCNIYFFYVCPLSFCVCPFIFLCFFLFVYIYFTIFAKINTKTCDG